MPSINQVKSLYDMTEDFTWRWFLKCAAAHPSPLKRVPQKRYISLFLNANIKQKLLDKTLSLPYLKIDFGDKFMLLKLLGDPTTLCIDMTKGGKMFIDEVFNLYRTLDEIYYIYKSPTAASQVRIVRLGILCDVSHKADAKYIDDVNTTFFRSLKEMKYLRSITLSGVANLEILEILGECCPHLAYLDFRDSWLLNDESIARLLLKNPVEVQGLSHADIAKYKGEKKEFCQNIYYFCFSGSDTSLASVALALSSLPSLESFGGHVYSGSLCHLIDLFHHEGFQTFKLTDLWNDKLSRKDAFLLTDVCPRLKHLNTSGDSLPSLSVLQPLESLTLDCDFRWCENELYDYLSVRGKTLKKLVLIEGENYSICLPWIIDLTPELEHLEAYIDWNDGSTTQEWKKMKCAVVTFDSSYCLKEFLFRVPSILKLHVNFQEKQYSENYSCINDDLIVDVASQGYLSKLEEFHVDDCHCGIVALECLLLNCPDIKYVGKLCFWRMLPHSYVESLHELSKLKNWNLTLDF